jgi:hypothetical protein
MSALMLAAALVSQLTLGPAGANVTPYGFGAPVQGATPPPMTSTSPSFGVYTPGMYSWQQASGMPFSLPLPGQSPFVASKPSAASKPTFSSKQAQRDQRKLAAIVLRGVTGKAQRALAKALLEM